MFENCSITVNCQQNSGKTVQITKKLGLIGAVLLCVCSASLLASESSTEAGGRFSPFPELVDIDGNAVTDQASVGNGKWILVMIWATDCAICREQKPQISAFHTSHKDKNAEVFGIALDGRDALAAVQAYVDNHDVSFPTYIGELPVVASALQQIAEEPLRGTPTYLLFDPSGEIKGVNPGPLSPGSIERFIEKNSS